jgi:hypothetical protein
VRNFNSSLPLAVRGRVVDGELYLAWEVDAVKLFAPCDPGAVVLLHGWRSSSWIGFLPLAL